MKPITNPDTKNTDPVYWEEVLHSHGLGLDDCGLLDPDPVSIEEEQEYLEFLQENRVDIDELPFGRCKRTE